MEKRLEKGESYKKAATTFWKHGNVSVKDTLQLKKEEAEIKIEQKVDGGAKTISTSKTIASGTTKKNPIKGIQAGGESRRDPRRKKTLSLGARARSRNGWTPP